MEKAVTVETVREALKKLWAERSEEERLQLAIKCHINKRVLEYFVDGDNMRLFVRTYQDKLENDQWIANRVGYVLMSGQPHP